MLCVICYMTKLTPLKFIFLTEIITIFLIVLGFFPREAALFLTGILVFYIIFSPLKDALVLTIASIPLYVALPVTENFDSMANWRVILAVLFLTLFIKQGISISLRRIKEKIRVVEKFKHFPMEYLIGAFLAIGLLSLINATDVASGIKRLLFFVNIFLLYIIIRNIAQDKTTIVRLFKAGAVAGIISIAVSYAQFISIFFVSLYQFWMWWVDHAISLFYGQGLTNLLGYSNTWFSYYPNKPPTIRMFSVFPDSHSFAIFSILVAIFLLTLAYYYKLKKNKRLLTTYCLLFVSCLLSIILSGSRGAWISGGGVLVLLSAIYLFAKIRPVPLKGAGRDAKIILATFIIFILLFPVSSLILGWSQRTEGALATKRDSFLVFERAKSSIDIEETSVRSRWDIWKATLASIKKHPLLGVGVGNFPVVLKEDISAAKRGASAHNLYMDVASEMGILGLVVLVLIFWQILKISWFTFRDSEDRLYKFFAAAFCVYFLWVLGYSLFDVVLLNDKVLMLFVAGVGILYSIKSTRETKFQQPAV